MAISESQLETWTHLGSVAQSRDTYAAIKIVLHDSRAPYARVGADSFLQGSYANDTNIRADSDVDIVLKQTSLFYYNIDALGEAEKSEFRRIHHSPAEYDLRAFKRDVTAWLAHQYSADLDTSGKKALHIKGRANRRNADVLVAARHKRFTAFPNAQEQAFVEGVIFFPANGPSIVNYPKQHSDNMTAKHQLTNGKLKPTVRVFKNMRNRMIEGGLIANGVAPSYFIEGMLYNVPKDKFCQSLQDTVAQCWGWLAAADASRLVCVNEQHALIMDGPPVSWRLADFTAFLKAIQEFWTQ